ncbi:GAF domain-containing protein [Streptomyces sp. WAC05374]|uniref:PP2C family protein-serine/threonine phosphatase n=1 Tax=Streptomyces sp. WAC05374 TaxID=2487420 RepID=UPI000F88AD14|nr:GAF domain-containing SpoIIE family protein phosphatase [Streptomyces sp. WAC05374]RST08567.1 GAF domain-containing protein [Streptomyces sp. WAC05374]TDF50128.1 GAF domain-containing protein [Streptomyces sp. WAC05374]TDF57853.1 GAF domain-containing protein [Streptomyces sp. WAC05374]TDF60382.1 GAF domain-containing protein [Streptomyces sp. WAC05374]
MNDFEVDQVVQRALDRLTLLAETTTAMTSTLDSHAAVRRVCRILVPQLADWCAVDLLDDDGRPRRISVVHRNPGILPVGGLTGPLPDIPEEPVGPLSRVLIGAGPLLLTATDILGPDRAADPLHARQLELFDQLGTHTAVVAPVRARRQVLGALTIGRSADRAPLTDDDLAMVEDLTHRIALGVDNARLHRETQHIAERLQRSLLPTLPKTGPLRLAARYTPAAATAEVGGDWYDSFPLPNGSTTMIMGDVTGHDLRAAITMSQLRNMLRGIGCDRQEPPGHILRRLDLAHQSLYPHATATCLYALLDQDDEGWTLAYSSAGHPPPLLVTHEGDTRYLKGGRGLLLGVDPDLPRTHATETLPPRSTVLMYTDGLIERRGEDLSHGMTRLRQHAAALAREDLDTFCDELIAGMTTDHTDDIALLVARMPARPRARG